MNTGRTVKNNPGCESEYSEEHLKNIYSFYTCKYDSSPTEYPAPEYSSIECAAGHRALKKNFSTCFFKKLVIEAVIMMIRKRIFPVYSATLFLTLLHLVIPARAGATTIEFTCDSSTGIYAQKVSGTLRDSSVVNIFYHADRKKVLFKNQNRLWMRYSYDGFATCRDIELTYNEKSDDFSCNLKIPSGVREISIAFFSTYEFAGNYYKIWDSCYGKNFTFAIADSRELEKKRKFEQLEKMAGTQH